MSFAHMHAFSYASCLNRLDEVRFVGVADEDASRAKKAARQFGVKAFPDYASLLEAELDAVIVTSENANHRRHAVAAAQAEKHVLCEKPLATTIADAEAIVEVCRRAGVKLMTAFPCRFHPAFARLRQAVSAGDLGKILAIKATNQGICPGGWFTQTELSGGGAVIDHTVHVLDLIRVLTGAEPVRVYAEIDNRFCGGDFDDTGLLTIDFSDGVFATIDTSWSRPKSSPFWGNVTLEVTGEAGRAEMDMFAQKIDHISDRTKRYTHEYWGDDIDLAMVRSFARSVATDSGPEVSGDDGLAALRIALAAYDSAAVGEAVELPR